MVRIHKILTTLIFVYAAGHFIYPVFDNSGLTSKEPLMWFLSGGLAVLYSGFINLSHLIVGGNFTKRISIVTNATILLFMLVLSVVIPEIHVFILAIIYLLVLIVTAKSSLTEPTYETNE